MRTQVKIKEKGKNSKKKIYEREQWDVWLLYVGAVWFSSLFLIIKITNFKKSCMQYKQIQEETYFKNSLPPKLFLR